MFDFESLPPLRKVIKEHGLQAMKSLGQNFLLDANITDKIARSAGDLSDVTVFEVGPGPGGLTRSLLKTTAKKIIAVEFDERAVNALQKLQAVAGKRLQIVAGDALKTNLLTLAPDTERVIVANLPYNIATPLLVNWLRQIYEAQNAYTGMTLMFQKEVAQRIVAGPGTKAYGRLSVLGQWLCQPEKLFDLPPNAFTPPPKVKSSIVRFTPRNLEDNPPDFAAVEKVTREAFGQRRKMLRSSLKAYLPILEELGIDATLRAENLSPQSFVDIAGRV